MHRLIYPAAMTVLLLVVGRVWADEQEQVDPQAGSQDNAIVLTWTSAERFFVLMQMQQFFGGMQVISDAVLHGDLNVVAPAVRSMGAEHDIPVSLEEKRPAAFELAAGFDQVALDAETPSPVSHTLSQVADALQARIGHHAENGLKK